MIIQIILSVFLLFAVSRVLNQVKSGKLTISAFLFWTALFVFALIGVLDPHLTTFVAKFLGIGRGSDVVFYIAIALVYYLIFRVSISIEENRRDLSRLIQALALEKMTKQNKKRKKKNKK